MFWRKRPSLAEKLRREARDAIAAQGEIAPAELPRVIGHLVGLLLDDIPAAGVYSWTELEAIVLSAWSELQAHRAGAHVDLEASTPHMLVLVDARTRARRPIPVVDLVRILGPRSVA